MFRTHSSLLLLCVLLCACGQESQSTAQSQQRASSAPPAGSAHTIIVYSEAEASAWTVTLNGGRVEIAIGKDERLVGEQRGNKRHYRRGSDGSAYAEVKSSDSGFKLRGPDSQLWWKVKISEDKIKISDNEENNQPWVLKTKYEDKVKILDWQDNEIGQVRVYPETAKVKVKNSGGTTLYTADVNTLSAGYGVLALDGINALHQGILMAELIASGR